MEERSAKVLRILKRDLTLDYVHNYTNFVFQVMVSMWWESNKYWRSIIQLIQMP